MPPLLVLSSKSAHTRRRGSTWLNDVPVRENECDNSTCRTRYSSGPVLVSDGQPYLNIYHGCWVTIYQTPRPISVTCSHICMQRASWWNATKRRRQPHRCNNIITETRFQEYRACSKSARSNSLAELMFIRLIMILAIWKSVRGMNT